jgi:hypothetical protein
MIYRYEPGTILAPNVIWKSLIARVLISFDLDFFFFVFIDDIDVNNNNNIAKINITDILNIIRILYYLILLN